MQAKFAPLFLVLCCGALSAQALRDLAGERGIRVGAAVDPNRLSENAYATTLGREFNQLTAENVMKFGLIHPTRMSYNFTPADTLVTFARSRGMAVRGHVFVWHNQTPGWLTGGNFTPEQLSTILQEHITTVGSHFAGQVYAWDVVNEAFNDNGTMRSTIWHNQPGIGETGTGYIEQAFRWARAADPQALLFYNDYNAETMNAKSDAIYRMAQDFKAREVPIDGIGLQAHFTANPLNVAGLEANIKRITDLGLQVQITELDVRLPVDASGVASPAALAMQERTYRDVMSACLKYPLCTAVQTWGFTDRYSWIPGSFPGMGAGLPFNANYEPKPAYTALQNALQAAPPVIAAAGLANAASYASGAVTPGEIIVFFGPTYGPSSLAVSQADAAGRIPTQLSETRLWFDGIPAPILYSQVGQISAIVPFSVSGQTTTEVVYEYKGLRSNAVSVNVASTLPGLFTQNSSGSGAGAILDAGFRPVGQTNPARRGSVVMLFATGGSLLDQAGVDGQIAAGPVALAAPVSVTIGGVACAVKYAGSASGLVTGAIQVNIEVGSAVPSGPQPVVLTIGGNSSQAGVTIWVE